MLTAAGYGSSTNDFEVARENIQIQPYNREFQDLVERMQTNRAQLHFMFPDNIRLNPSMDITLRPGFRLLVGTNWIKTSIVNTNMVEATPGIIEQAFNAVGIVTGYSFGSTVVATGDFIIEVDSRF
jgi:hypothetical protein